MSDNLNGQAQELAIKILELLEPHKDLPVEVHLCALVNVLYVVLSTDGVDRERLADVLDRADWHTAQHLVLDLRPWWCSGQVRKPLK